MKLYIYGDGEGNFYQGRSPTGRVKYTQTFTTATFFTEWDKDDAEDCIDLGLNLYSVEVSAPELEKEGTVSAVMPGVPERAFDDWAVNPMDLFGKEQK